MTDLDKAREALAEEMYACFSGHGANIENRPLDWYESIVAKTDALILAHLDAREADQLHEAMHGPITEPAVPGDAAAATVAPASPSNDEPAACFHCGTPLNAVKVCPQCNPDGQEIAPTAGRTRRVSQGDRGGKRRGSTNGQQGTGEHPDA